MAPKLTVKGEVHYKQDVRTFLRRLEGRNLQKAGAMGLNEHAAEQRKQSIVRISSTMSEIPRGRISGTMKVRKARPSASMTAIVETADQAISLAEYGKPGWKRDLNPGWKGGPVSSMAGAEATAWGRRQTFKHAFVAKGQVLVRTGPARDAPLKRLSAAVLANELAKPTRPNVKGAERYAALDLEKRVTRHILRALGT